MLGDKHNWSEPMAFEAALHPHSGVLATYRLSVGDAETGLRPDAPERKRRVQPAPKEWLFVIKGPRHSGNDS